MIPKIFTTYFARLRNMDNVDPIAIVRYPPKWYNGRVYQTLAPNPDILLDYKYSDSDWQKFEKKYKEQLDCLDPEEVLNDLKTLSSGKDIALVCFEKDSEHCHRSICAKWLSDNLGICVSELQF